MSEKNYFVHESSYIDEPSTIGEGTKIWHFSHILKNVAVGRTCNIGQNVVIGPNVKVGDNCKIQNNVSVYEGVELEDNVFCGPSMVFTNVFNPRSEFVRKAEYRKTLVKRGASIGANATVVCGSTIGAYAFVGAGSVVTRDVPDYALVMGNPARRTAWMCRCGEKLGKTRVGETATCPACAARYEVSADRIAPLA
jgi:UDP-2-acetamido-3-amino-2,3-dideoxy-glucuronate N-acetyltransferase